LPLCPTHLRHSHSLRACRANKLASRNRNIPETTTSTTDLLALKIDAETGLAYVVTQVTQETQVVQSPPCGRDGDCSTRTVETALAPELYQYDPSTSNFPGTKLYTFAASSFFAPSSLLIDPFNRTLAIGGVQFNLDNLSPNSASAGYSACQYSCSWLGQAIIPNYAAGNVYVGTTNGALKDQSISVALPVSYAGATPVAAYSSVDPLRRVLNVWDGTYFHIIDLNALNPEVRIAGPSGVSFLASSFDPITGDTYILGQSGQNVAGPCQPREVGPPGSCTPTQKLLVSDPTVYRLTARSQTFDWVASYPRFSPNQYESVSGFAYDSTRQTIIGVDQNYSQSITAQGLVEVSQSSLCARVFTETFQEPVPRLFSIDVPDSVFDGYNFNPTVVPHQVEDSDLCGNTFNYTVNDIHYQNFSFFGAPSLAQ
jgi:hypothetical protein